MIVVVELVTTGCGGCDNDNNNGDSNCSGMEKTPF